VRQTAVSGEHQLASSAKRILLVDDDKAILKIVQITLGSKGREVLNVSSGEAALELLRSTQVDLIVLDFQLPGMSGVDVARTLQKKPATAAIPIIMLTGSAKQNLPATDLDVFAYFKKPFSPRELLKKVSQGLMRKPGSGA
jgi:CheY-like chemotaxis protein